MSVFLLPPLGISWTSLSAEELSTKRHFLPLTFTSHGFSLIHVFFITPVDIFSNTWIFTDSITQSGLLCCSSKLVFKEVHDWMCGSLSCSCYILHHLVVYSVCWWILQSHIWEAWHWHIWIWVHNINGLHIVCWCICFIMVRRHRVLDWRMVYK